MTSTSSAPVLPRLPEFGSHSPLRPSRFGHIVLRTARFEAMNAFYKKLLNAQAMFETPMAAFLTFDDEHHRVLLVNDPDAQPKNPRAAGLAHFAFLFGELDDLLATYERLKAAALEPTLAVNHGFQLSFYYRDPDENEVELGCDCFPTREAINDWFQNGIFAADPFGFLVDPTAMLAERRSGVGADVVLRASYAGVPAAEALLRGMP
jgi:catechol 2,3-dioxygenase-like lactoylglutathione lyase family enzyme